MKKLLFATTLTGIVCITACNSAADKKAGQDSSANDSATAAHHTDSLMMVQKQQHTQDSLKAAQAKAVDTTKGNGTKQ